MIKTLGNYYTYIYYDPSRGNEPIYVGKGKGGRAWDHIKRTDRHPFTQRLQYMSKNSVSPIIGIYAGLDEEFALFLEEELIAKFGRKMTGEGPLLNRSSGGESPASGATWKLSEEVKERMKKAHAGKKGIPHTPEAKAKITEGLKGRVHSDETKAKIAAGNKGKKKPVSEEARKSLSAALKGKPKSEEWKAKMREINRIKREQRNEKLKENSI